MTHVTGFLAPVPAANKDAYIKHAETAARYFKQYGALSVVECWEAEVPDGQHTSFPMAVKKEDDEVVVFSWITWPDKATADAAWEKMQADTDFAAAMGEMPFDGKRMMWGGFDMVVDH